jgi:CMP-N-acetylneuraminic acid synthetase/phosphoglycolate phosphatase-like HAD superfamily hydrolase
MGIAYFPDYLNGKSLLIAMRIAALVPVKLNSRRLPNKNFLMLGNRPLSHYIFDTLLGIESIDSVYCFTSQNQILSLLPPGVKILPRPSYLDQDCITGNQLFDYAVDKLSDFDLIVLCHPTGPFIEKESILKGISAISSGGFDSAFAVEKHLTYAWHNNSPINYNPCSMTQTQDLAPIYTETSGFYAFLRKSYLEAGSRIGSRPFLVEVSKREAVDIDFPSDFAYAEHLLSFNPEEKDLSFDRFFADIIGSSSVHGKIRHLSFDLDGVIIDSLETMRASWKAVQEEFCISQPFEEYAKHIGRPLSDILSAIGISSAICKEVASYYTDQTALHSCLTRINADIVALIQDMIDRGIKISIVTSKPKIRASAIVNEIFGDKIRLILTTPDDLPSGRGKPAPDPLMLACCLNGCDPAESLYIGDMRVDSLAAQRAGIHFVHASWGYEDIPELDQVWFSSPADLCAYLRDVIRE